MRITDGGVTGWGEAMPLPGWPGADLPATKRALEAWAADPDPDPVNLPQERFARAAVELALLDAEARRRGLTPAEVLAGGSSVAGSVEVNRLVADVDEARAEVVGGYGTVKLKVGGSSTGPSSAEECVAGVGAVREAIGPGVRLRLDANGAWATEQAVEMLDRLEQFDIEYVEEPVAGMDALAEVAERSPVPVAVDDSLGSVGTLVPEAIAVVVVKPMALGGPRTAHAAACRWINEGRKVVVTNYLDSAIGQHAALSVAAALPGPPQVCGAITPDLFTRDLADLPPVAPGPLRGSGHLPRTNFPRFELSCTRAAGEVFGARAGTPRCRCWCR